MCFFVFAGPVSCFEHSGSGCNTGLCMFCQSVPPCILRRLSCLSQPSGRRWEQYGKTKFKCLFTGNNKSWLGFWSCARPMYYLLFVILELTVLKPLKITLLWYWWLDTLKIYHDDNATSRVLLCSLVQSFALRSRMNNDNIIKL